MSSVNPATKVNSFPRSLVLLTLSVFWVRIKVPYLINNGTLSVNVILLIWNVPLCTKPVYKSNQFPEGENTYLDVLPCYTIGEAIKLLPMKNDVYIISSIASPKPVTDSK